jgi:hypothetical protein
MNYNQNNHGSFLTFYKRKIKLDFGIQSSHWVKINLDPMVRWRELDKIHVHKYITYNFQ